MTPRVALVTNLAGHYRAPLFAELDRRLDIDVYLTGAGVDTYWSPNHTLAADGHKTRQVRGAISIYRALRNGRYDVIICGLVGRKSLLAALLASFGGPAATVVWIGMWAHPVTLFHRLTKPVVRLVLRRADAVITYGPHVSNHVRQVSGRTRGVYVAPQAINNDSFRSVKRRERDRGGVLSAVFVGRLEPEKGIDVFIDALALVKHAVHGVVIGEGSLAQELQNQALRAGVQERVSFAGYVGQEELPAQLASADVLVIPSVATAKFHETWGFVANEAMNVGLPVIATDVVGAAAGGLIIDGKTGRVVPQRDPAALALALDELAHDEELRRSLGNCARQRVLDWNFAVAADGFIAAIEAALEARGT